MEWNKYDNREKHTIILSKEEIKSLMCSEMKPIEMEIREMLFICLNNLFLFFFFFEKTNIFTASYVSTYLTLTYTIYVLSSRKYRKSL